MCRTCGRSSRCRMRMIVICRLVFCWRCLGFGVAAVRLLLAGTTCAMARLLGCLLSGLVAARIATGCLLSPMRCNITAGSRLNPRSTSGLRLNGSLFSVRSCGYATCWLWVAKSSPDTSYNLHNFYNFKSKKSLPKIPLFP